MADRLINALDKTGNVVTTFTETDDSVFTWNVPTIFSALPPGDYTFSMETAETSVYTVAAANAAPTITASDSLTGRTLEISVDTLTGNPAPSVSLTTLTLDGVDVSGGTTGSGPWSYVVPDDSSDRTIAWTLTATNSEGSNAASGSKIVSGIVSATVPAQMSVPALTGGDESATLTLATPAPNDGGSTITLYTWEVDAASGDFSSPVLTGSQSPGDLGNPIDVSPLTGGDYKARSWAVNAEGSGNPSAASSEATVTSAAVDPSITSATFTAPTSSSNPQLIVDVDYAGSDDVELVLETSETVGGAAIETLTQSPYVSGQQFSLTTNSASDANATVLRVTIQEVNNGGVSSTEVIEDVSLVFTASTAPETFQYQQNGTTAGPTVDTLGSYPGGGFSLRILVDGATDDFCTVFRETDNSGELEVSVDPSDGQISIRARQNGGSTIFDENVDPKIALDTDADGMSDILIHYINDPASTVTSATNRVEVYVNGVVYDPDSVFFGNTNWLAADDNRSRQYSFFRETGWSTTRGPGFFSEMELWWGVDVGTGPTKPSATPHLRVVADSTGPFTSPFGGSFRIFDSETERTA